ncbi:helix-turn-helix domain-containing protein [Terasakiella pusilla]|uniref:helix-turn-helix domain-containing protein n=1 Tax=Terasakiella pusilla TaxID=64973 RepID=UPI003AA7D917
MTEIKKQSVHARLSQSKATALANLQVGADRALAVWRNTHDLVTYEETDGHTFSFYLAGGKGVRRLDVNSDPGWPGAVCVMPQGHTSLWEVQERIEFLHVYLSDRELRRLYAHTFDKDARLLEVVEQTFVSAQGQLAEVFGQLHQAVYSQNTLLAEEAIVSFFSESMMHRVLGEAKMPSLTGGLPPKKLQLVKDYVISNLSQQVSLKELADLVGLSEYHFQRNFTAQCGVSPHAWLTALRIDHAKDLMRSDMRMADISEACGFANQSHFSRTFKGQTGATPGGYRKGCGLISSHS